MCSEQEYKEKEGRDLGDSVSATERKQSCHFGHPPGALVKGKIGPQKETDLFDSWLSHSFKQTSNSALFFVLQMSQS